MMEKKMGFVTFNNKKVKEGNTIEEETVVFDNIIDSLKFSNIDDDKQIAIVSYESGKNIPDDDYYEYYNMILTNKLVIEKVLSYDEIIFEVKSCSEGKLIKFFRSFKLNESEICMFSKTNIHNWQAIEFYQKGNNVYEKDQKKLVKEYGKYNNKRCEGE